MGGGGGMNWVIGIDVYTLMCIKRMTNKNLLYKKINTIKFKKKKSQQDCQGSLVFSTGQIWVKLQGARGFNLPWICPIGGSWMGRDWK